MHTEKLSFEEHQLEAGCKLTIDELIRSNYYILEEQPQEEHDKINACKIYTITNNSHDCPYIDSIITQCHYTVC